MKRLGLLALVIALCAPMFADETCDQALAEGKTLYKSGKYKQAKEMFDFVVNECGSSYGESATWSKKCTTALNAAKKTTTSTEKKSTATSTTKTTTTSTAETSTVTKTPAPSATEAIAKLESYVEYTYIYSKDNTSFCLKGDTTIQAEPGAEGYKLLRDYIDEKEQAKTGAISSFGKGVVIFGSNGISPNNIPTVFYDTILAINNRRETIIDVAMSNNMKYYCVVYDKNKYFTNGPVAFKNTLKEYSDANEEFLSVSVNDAGDFAVVTNKHYYCSNPSTRNFAEQIQKDHGYIYSINISNKGVAICTADGVYFEKLPPEVYHRMRNFLNRTTPIKIKVVKFTDGGTCLITDGESQYTYRL